MVESLPSLLTSQTEIEQLFGVDAVLYRIDDDESDAIDAGLETDALNDVMLEATDEVYFHCEGRYTPTNLLANRWARRAASTVAAYFLSQRRGQSDQYVSSYERLKERLIAIKEGRFSIPRMTTAHDERPAMSNIVIDDRYARAKAREQTDIGEGTTDGSQDADWPLILEP